MTAYYNEYDKKAAAWLRQLIKNGLIADGVVDERSITEVTAGDLRGFTQHHFFAGIGGWSYALRLAGWPDDRPVVSASLPCQPFSVAGAGKGKDDERHLLPHFIELVKQCNFKTIFGEQVPGAIKHGWLDDLCFEMERENYAVGSIVLTAAGAGSAQIRQRLFWVADSNGEQAITTDAGRLYAEPISGSGMGDTESVRSGEGEQDASGCGEGGTESEVSQSIDICKGRMGDTKHDGQSTGGGGMVYADGTGSQSRWELTEETGHWSAIEPDGGIIELGRWSEPDWLYCRDDKYRPIKPGIKPLVDGVSRGVGYSSDTSQPIDADATQEARVMRLKGYGNAICPQVASQFISAFMKVQNDNRLFF